MAISRCEPARVSEAFLSGAFCLIPIVFLFAFRDSFVLPKFFAAAAVSAAVLAIGVYAGSFRALRSSLDVPLAAFAAACLVSGVCSVDGWLSWAGPDRVPLAALPGLALGLSGFYAGRISAAIGSDDFLDSLCFWTVAGAVPVSLLALGEMAAGVTVLGPRHDAARAISSFGAPTLLASYLALVLPFAYREARAGLRARRILGFCVLAVGTAALLATRSRAGLLGAGLGISVAYWLAYPRSRNAWRRAGWVSLAALLLGGIGYGVVSRSGDATRFHAWAIAVEQWREMPFLGSGPGTFTLAFRGRASAALLGESNGMVSFAHAHNDWFEVLSSLGALGAAAFAWLHWGALRAGVTVFSGVKEGKRPLAAAAFGALAATLVILKFNFPAVIVVWMLAVWTGAFFAPAGEGGVPAPAVAVLAGGAAAFALVFSVWNASADRMSARGRRARAEGRPREAAALFAGAIRRDPGKIVYRLDFLNTIFDSAGDSPEAVGAATAFALDGVRRRPFESEMHRMLGLAQKRRGRFDEARIAFENAVRLAPTMLPARNDLAEVAALQEDASRRPDLKQRLEDGGRRD